ncbi:MAG: DUF3592 domain-containing protein [Oscillospiraceae bacterium]
MMLLLQAFPILIALLCIGLAFLPEHHKSIRNPVYTDGIIVRKNVQRIQKRQTETEAFAPVCRYKVGEREITATSREYFPEWQYHYLNGQQVKICYDEQNPDLFQICGNKSEWKKGVLLTVGIGTLVAYFILRLQYH